MASANGNGFVSWLRSQSDFDPILVATDPKVAAQAKAAYQKSLASDASSNKQPDAPTVAFYVAIKRDKKGKAVIVRGDAATFGKGRSAVRAEIEGMHEILSAAADVTCVQLRATGTGVEIVGATVAEVLGLYGLTAAQVDKIEVQDHSKSSNG